MQIIKTIYAAAIETDPDSDIATFKGLEGLFENVVVAIMGFAGIVLFIMLIFGGIQYMTAGGDAKGVESAKGTLTAAIAGLVLVAISYLILLLIKQITGVNVIEFKIFQ